MDKDVGDVKEVVIKTREAKVADAGGSKRVSDSGLSRGVDSDAGSAGGISVCELFMAELSPMLLASLSAIATVGKIKL